MRIDTGEEIYEANRDNSWVLIYPNDMLNCMYTDLDDDYAVISAEISQWADIYEQAQIEEIDTIFVEEGVDLDDAPHLWVVNSLAKFTILAAESFIE